MPSGIWGYSQRGNMIWISGIWITTQSDNTISPPNKDNMPITNIQIPLGSISRVQSTTNYEGNGVHLRDGDGMMMVLMWMVMKMPPPTPRRSPGDNGLDFPFSGGLGAA